jgi:hypothetical protein
MNLKLAAAAIALSLSSSAFAHGHGYGHGQRHHFHNGSGRWVAPLVTGVVIGALVTGVNSRPVVVQDWPASSMPVPAPQVVDSNCLVTIRNPYTGNYENVVVSCSRIQN